MRRVNGSMSDRSGRHHLHNLPALAGTRRKSVVELGGVDAGSVLLPRAGLDRDVRRQPALHPRRHGGRPRRRSPDAHRPGNGETPEHPGHDRPAARGLPDRNAVLLLHRLRDLDLAVQLGVRDPESARSGDQGLVDRRGLHEHLRPEPRSGRGAGPEHVPDLHLVPRSVCRLHLRPDPLRRRRAIAGACLLHHVRGHRRGRLPVHPLPHLGIR